MKFEYRANSHKRVELKTSGNDITFEKDENEAEEPAEHGPAVLAFLDKVTENLAANSEYALAGNIHRIIGTWFSEKENYGLAMTQEVKQKPVMSLTLLVQETPGQGFTKQLYPILLCNRGCGPFVMRDLLKALERLPDDGGPETQARAHAQLRGLAGIYAHKRVGKSKSGDTKLAYINNDSYRAGRNVAK